MLVKQASIWAMPTGSCIASNMASRPMVRHQGKGDNWYRWGHYGPALAYRLLDLPTGCNQGDANTQSIDTAQGAMQFTMGVQVWRTIYNHGCPGRSRGSLKVTFNFKARSWRGDTHAFIATLPKTTVLYRFRVSVVCVFARFTHSE